MHQTAVTTIADDFRSMMAAFPTGVAIVTTLGPGGQPCGMTCSSVCSITLAPPTLLVSLRCGSPTLGAILGRRTFVLNLLHGDARPAAELFASGRTDRFDHVRWRGGAGGPELADAAHAAAHCQVRRTERVGGHMVIFGEVFRVWPPAEPVSPLLYGLRRYATWPLGGHPEGSSYEVSARDVRSPRPAHPGRDRADL
jgi:flavin reductase (DIM6/NTAB) family NADH-FMN oxidoreductase RutF